jgi:hypothetical protein
MNRRRYFLAFIVAILILIAGVFVLLSGGGMAAMRMVDCDNHFALDAPDAHCRAPLYWWYSGGLLIMIGFVGGIAVGVLAYLSRRRARRVIEPRA